MKRPAIGALRSRVTIEAPVDTPDGAGGFTRSYTTLAQVWAKIDPVGARDDFVEQRQEQSTTHIVTIRWRGDVQSQMRLIYRSRRLLILSVVDLRERRRFLVCSCEEIS